MTKKKQTKKPKSKSKSKIDLKNDPNVRFSEGDFVLPNGDKYSGEFCAHKAGIIWRQGKGIYTSHEGQTYEGLWSDDKLVDDSEVTITFQNGVNFCGRLRNHKYFGPGIYTLSNGLELSCEFRNNQPEGGITLIDSNGILWKGKAEKDRTVLIPENIFYLTLHRDKGKGITDDELREETGDGSFKGEGDEGEDNLPDDYWRDVIFAKSKITRDDVKFGDSEWVRKYWRFKKKKHAVEKKLKEKSPLSADEQIWLAKFMEFRDTCRNKRMEELLRKKKSEEAAFALNRKFNSPEFLQSNAQVKIIAPSKPLQTASTIAFLSKFSENRTNSSSPTSSSTPQIDQKQQHKKRNPFAIPEISNFPSTPDFTLDSPTTEAPTRDQREALATETGVLHFNDERKDKVVLSRVKERLTNRLFEDDEETKLLREIMDLSMTVLSTSGFEVFAKDEKEEKEAVPTAKSGSKVVETDGVRVEEDQSARMRRYIAEKIREWGAKRRDEEEVEEARGEAKEETLHLHSVGNYTGDIDDVPAAIWAELYQ